MLTSSVETFRRPEHAVLLREFGRALPLGAELLPLALAGFQFLVRLDFAGQLGGPGGSVADFAGLPLRLARQGGVDVRGGRDDVGVGGWYGGRRAGRAWGTISLAFLGIVGGGLDVLGGERFGGGVVLEGDDVDGFARGTGDGCDPRRVEGFVAGHPSRHHGVVDGEGCFRGSFFDRAGGRDGFSVASLIGGVLFLGPFLLHGRRGRLPGRRWC